MKNSAIAASPIDIPVMRNGCICCANGNDLPEAEHCRACGYGLPQKEAPKTKDSELAMAVKAARGGDAPIPFRGYA